MAWVVDTSVLLDIRQNDPQFGICAAKCLVQLPDGLVLCPITYIELAPTLAVTLLFRNSFSRGRGAMARALEPSRHFECPSALGQLRRRERSGLSGRRPVADLLIEAFAQRFQGLITRNPKHFTSVPWSSHDLKTPWSSAAIPPHSNAPSAKGGRRAEELSKLSFL